MREGRGKDWCGHGRAASGEDQATLAAPFEVVGPGLHTGRTCRVIVEPAPPDFGIRFRTLRQAADFTPATWRVRVPSRMSTALDLGAGGRLRTVEHLMASLASCGIDNAAVTVAGGEIPILDGSAGPWCGLIGRAGLRRQAAARHAIALLAPFEVSDAHGFVRGEPCDRCCVDVSTDRMPGFGVLRWSGAIDPETFRSAIAPSRSFGNASVLWRAALRSRLATRLLPPDLRHRLWLRSFHSQTVTGCTGPTPAEPRPECQHPISPWTLSRMIVTAPEPLLRGARPGRVAVVLGGRILGGARFPDEPVRHRVLDLLGDLALAGRPLRARIVANCPTHALTFAFVAELMARPELWRLEPAPAAPARARPERGPGIPPGKAPRRSPPARQDRMFTARAATSATVRSEIDASAIIRSLARCVSGSVSVGEKAVALVKERNR
ncbi:UDP-3-0-acyl N-acetylglucosamine deacetylase [Methylobacterium sp. 4-46]|nr:UDP-3-0-acyl N-acetylglucosamine deacetylase [Methylobacterium sp. 4-46]